MVRSGISEEHGKPFLLTLLLLVKTAFDMLKVQFCISLLLVVCGATMTIGARKLDLQHRNKQV